jgi:hypothetical protein
MWAAPCAWSAGLAAFRDYRRHWSRVDQSMVSRGIVESADTAEFGTIVRSDTRREGLTLAQPITGPNPRSPLLRQREGNHGSSMSHPPKKEACTRVTGMACVYAGFRQEKGLYNS